MNICCLNYMNTVDCVDCQYTCVTTLMFNSNNYRQGGNYSDVLPLKAARHESNFNLISVGASNLSCRQTKCRFI